MSSNLDFLKSYFNRADKSKIDQSNIKIFALTGDGGHRNYSRIIKRKSRFILMSCGERDSSLKLFINIQNRLKAHVSTPQVFKADLKRGLLLLEDLGDESLESFYLKNLESQSLFFYKQALKQLIKLQSQVPLYKKDPLFDMDFFLDEVEQALKDIEKYLDRFSKQASIDFSSKKSSLKFKSLKTEFQQIFSDIKKEDLVFCHRDYHSRNLMLKNRQIYMIDFQDGGKGPWFYDLASLLYDCYIPLQRKDTLCQFYFDNLPPFLKKQAKSLSHVKKQVELQFLQRGLKACGRFCAFKLENNKDTHLKYIPKTLSLMFKLARQRSYQQIAQYTKESLKRFQTTNIFKNQPLF